MCILTAVPYSKQREIGSQGFPSENAEIKKPVQLLYKHTTFTP